MHVKRRLLVATLALCVSSPALAVKPGGSLYVKARNTRLMASASPTANAVAILQPGQQVKWLGADPKNKQWHRVEVGGKKGLVFQSNLSTQPPAMELIAKEGTHQVDPVAFANSGAAAKGMSEGAAAYGRGKGTLGFAEAVSEIEALEKLAEAITPEEISTHVQKARLFPVVGPSETASRGSK